MKDFYKRIRPHLLAAAAGYFDALLQMSCEHATHASDLLKTDLAVKGFTREEFLDWIYANAALNFIQNYEDGLLDINDAEINVIALAASEAMVGFLDKYGDLKSTFRDRNFIIHFLGIIARPLSSVDPTAECFLYQADPKNEILNGHEDWNFIRQYLPELHTKIVEECRPAGEFLELGEDKLIIPVEVVRDALTCQLLAKKIRQDELEICAAKKQGNWDVAKFIEKEVSEAREDIHSLLKYYPLTIGEDTLFTVRILLEQYTRTPQQTVGFFGPVKVCVPWSDDFVLANLDAIEK